MQARAYIRTHMHHSVFDGEVRAFNGFW